MIRPPLVICSAVALLTSSAATAQFSGGYAPDTWTTTGVGIGGSSAIFAADGSKLTITGSDGGFGSTIKVTHIVLADGVWSFDWTFLIYDGESGFDVGYYTINGTKFFLSDSVGFETGRVSVPVTAGQTIGWQIVSVDGIFGPGVLRITDLQIPAQGILAVLGLGGWVASRRRA